MCVYLDQASAVIDEAGKGTFKWPTLAYFDKESVVSHELPYARQRGPDAKSIGQAIGAICALAQKEFLRQTTKNHKPQ